MNQISNQPIKKEDSMQRQRGFTLIELLVVIAIIGILATLVVTQLGGARVKARNSSVKSDITEMGKAVEVYKNDDRAADKVISVAAKVTIADTGGSKAPFNTTTPSYTGTLDYGLKINKTPGVGYSYYYSTSTTTTALETATYTICGNTVATGGDAAGALQITDGQNSSPTTCP